MEYFKYNVIFFFESCLVEDVICIVILVYFESLLYWGLFCFDVTIKIVYFDDGLKI